MSGRNEATVPVDQDPAAIPASLVEPDAAFRLRLSAQKLYAEGRANPVCFQCSTWIGIWVTEDRITWRTTNGLWLAQLERSENGRHVWMAVLGAARGTVLGVVRVEDRPVPEPHTLERLQPVGV